jgi:hypothetical protein
MLSVKAVRYPKDRAKYIMHEKHYVSRESVVFNPINTYENRLAICLLEDA